VKKRSAVGSVPDEPMGGGGVGEGSENSGPEPLREIEGRMKGKEGFVKKKRTQFSWTSRGFRGRKAAIRVLEV